MTKSKSKHPLISVILPVYNGQEFLREALDSLEAQTYPYFEVLMLDDGSTDASAAIMQEYAERDERFKYLPAAHNCGLIDTLNKGIALSNGEFIARMDADDVCEPQRFAAQITRMQNRPFVAMTGTLGRYIGERTEAIRQPTSSRDIGLRLYFDNPIVHASVMFNAAFLRRTGLAYNKEALHCEDYDLWTRIVKAGGVVENLHSSLIRYRVHAGSISQSKQEIQEATAGQIRRCQFATLGIECTPEQIELMDRRMFTPGYELTPVQIRTLRVLLGSLQARLTSYDQELVAYELGRFTASLFPRPKTLKDKARLFAALMRIHPRMAVEFTKHYLQGKR